MARAARRGSAVRRWLLPVLAALAASQSPARAQSPADYERLLKATGYLESFQRTAGVAERVFAARAQGSDPEFARFMGIISRADLAPIRSCVAAVYRQGGFTKAEVLRLVEIFESPLGAKLRDQSEQILAKAYETGALQKPDFSTFSASEIQQVAALNEEDAFRKYGRHAARPETSRAIMGCMLELDEVQRSGLDLPKG